MGLFSKRKIEEKVEKAEIAPQPAFAAAVSTASQSLAHVLRHARITEKASMHQSLSVYTFDIARRATKQDVMQAVRALYRVTPRKVRIVSIRAKSRRNVRSGKLGMTGGGKKAYVYLKKGETITIG